MSTEHDKHAYRRRQTERIETETRNHYRRIHGALLIGAIVVVCLWKHLHPAKRWCI